MLNLLPTKFSAINGDINFSNCHVTWHCSRDHKIMWLLCWKPLTVSQHLAWFGVHGSSGSIDIIHSICHVISQDYLIEGLCEFIDGSSSRYFTTLTSMVTIGILRVAMFSVLHMTSHVKRFMWFCGWEPFIASDYPPKFSENMHCDTIDIIICLSCDLARLREQGDTWLITILPS